MPVVHSLEKTMENRVTEFYGKSSIYRPNKFLVGFYGEYVDQAIKKLESDTRTERNPNNQYNGTSKLQLGTDIHTSALNQWKTNHYFKEDSQVELKWGCSEAIIPSIQPTTESGLCIDSIKNIKYPMIRDAGGLQSVEIEITEDRHLMFYQFFNALINRFFTPQILKARSSVQKLGMYIAVLQEDFVIPQGVQENGIQRDQDLDAIVSQIFEFNSIVPKGIPNLTFNNDIKTPLKYSIRFDAPNAFQGSFKTSFKGLRNNTSDTQFMTGFDSNSLDATGQEYIKSNFEVSTNSLMTTQNGVYEKTLKAE
jgi:hypothetical protein